MLSSNLFMIPTSSRFTMKPSPFSFNSQEPMPTSLQNILQQHPTFIPPYILESQSSALEKPCTYGKFSSTRLVGTKAPYNPLADQDESCRSPSPVSQSQNNQQASSAMKPRDQQRKKQIISQKKDEFGKAYTLPKGWTEEKDQRLLQLATQYKGEWKRLARIFAQRSVTPLFVKYRFQELTSAPKQTRAKFHPTEDLMLAKYYDKYGSNWAQIATHFPNRTAVMLKNRYYSYIRKQGILDILTEKAKEREQTEYVDLNKFDENSQLFSEQTAPGSSIDCKEEPNSEFEIKLKYISGSESAAETNNKFEETPQLFSEHRTPESSIYCKEELNNESEAKLEHFPVSGSAAEITMLRNQVEFYQMLYFKTKFELDSIKAQVTRRTY